MITKAYVVIHQSIVLFIRIPSQRFIFIFIKGLLYKLHIKFTAFSNHFNCKLHKFTQLHIGVFVHRNWKQVGSHLDPATICYTLQFPIEMVAIMPFLADFMCVKRFEIVLHGGLSEENSQCIYISNCLGCGAAQLEI